MSGISYAIKVHNEYELQTFEFDSDSVGNIYTVAEADVDAAVQAFATALVSGSASTYPLTLDYIRKTTTTTTVTTVSL